MGTLCREEVYSDHHATPRNNTITTMKLFAISFFAVVLASTGSFIPLNEELFIDWTERATAVKANIGAGVVLANTTYLNCTADANCTFLTDPDTQSTNHLNGRG